MRKYNKKMLSIILTLAMVITMIPIFEITASAGTSSPSGFWTDGGNYDTVWEGNGTKSNPYKISSAAELAGLAYLVNSIPMPDPKATGNKQNACSLEDVSDEEWVGHDNHFSGKYFVLTANIDLGDHYWVPIGNDFRGYIRRAVRTFEGSFDGQGYTISNMVIDTTKDSTKHYGKAFGLFGAVGGVTLGATGTDDDSSCVQYRSKNTISNIKFSGGYANIETSSNQGLMVGAAAGYSCFVDFASIESDWDITIISDGGDYSYNAPCQKIGGIIGDATSSNILNCSCSAEVSVDSKDYADRIICGGILGDMLVGNIKTTLMDNCTYNGELKVFNGYSDVDIGGIFGRIRICTDPALEYYSSSEINNCVNNGNIYYDEGEYEQLVNDTSFIGGIGGRFNRGENGYFEGDLSEFKLSMNNCINNGDIKFKNDNYDENERSERVGGILGTAKSAHVVGCINKGDITVENLARGDIGGITGRIQNNECKDSGEDTLVNCYNYGDLTVENSGYVFIGGITGRLKSEIIINCGNYGNVEASAYYRAVAGGLAGQIAGGDADSPAGSMILNSFNSGSIAISNHCTRIYSWDPEYDYCVRIAVGGLVGIACTDETVSNKDKSYLLENSCNYGKLSLDNHRGVDAVGFGGLVGMMSGETMDETGNGCEWDVIIDKEISAETFETPRHLIIKNCAWLDTCGASSDIGNPSDNGAKLSKTASYLGGKYINSLNINRKQTDKDADVFNIAIKNHSLSTDSCHWMADSKGMPVHGGKDFSVVLEKIVPILSKIPVLKKLISMRLEFFEYFNVLFGDLFK